ncbi:MAG: hypothetical protein JEZ06_01170 [Anaerolineaceae bacterium]|nr:hypothetical protein [Anaerolineaceae bacterium]
MKNRVKVFHISLLVLSIIGVIALLISTRWGPGVGGDATIYMMSARNLIEGKGLGLIGPQGEFRLLPYFPPFFSMTLGFFGLLGFDIFRTAQVLNAILFGGIVWITGMVVFRSTRSNIFSLLAAGLVLSSPVLIPVYSWAMSEPLAIFLGFSGVWIVLEYIWNPRKVGLFYLSAILFGLALLTRYNAAAFLGVGTLMVLFFQPSGFWKRVLKAIQYFVIGFLPMAVWMTFDFMQTDTFSSRRVEIALSLVEHARYLWNHFSYDMLFWLIPDSWIYNSPYPGLINKILPILAIVIVAAWFILIALRLKREGDKQYQKLRQLMILLFFFIIAFFSVIILVSSTTYPPITINNRMISPIHIAVLWIVALMAYSTVEFWKSQHWIKVVVPVFIALVVIWYGWRSAHIVNQNWLSGLGYSSVAWQNSEVIEKVKEMPSETMLITNETNAVLFLTGRAAYPLKEIYFDTPLKEFTAYGNGDLTNDDSQQYFKEEGYPLVLFDSIDDQLSGLYGERTGERISSLVSGLYRSYRGEDGGIFYYLEP